MESHEIIHISELHSSSSNIWKTHSEFKARLYWLFDIYCEVYGVRKMFWKNAQLGFKLLISHKDRTIFALLIVYSLYGLYPLLRLIFLPSFWFHFQLREYFELNRRINHKEEIFTAYIKLSVCSHVFLLHFQFEEQTHNLRCLDRKCWHILYHPKQSKIHRKR